MGWDSTCPFVGAIVYVDDIILIYPTKRRWTGICEVDANAFSIAFNAKKRIFLVFTGIECVEANASICKPVKLMEIR